MKLEPSEIAAGIALAGVLISALVAFSTSSRNVYVNSITATRIKWTDELRNNISQVIELATQHQIKKLYKNEYDAQHLREAKLKVVGLYHLMRLQLDYDRPVENNVLMLISAIFTVMTNEDKYEKGTFSLVLKHLSRHAAWLLRDEWSRIKIEASPLLVRAIMRSHQHTRRLQYRNFCDGAGNWRKALQPKVGSEIDADTDLN